MAAFYHGISMALWYGGSAFITTIISDYQAPSFPVSVTMAATSGPIEETLFFGVPYYLSGIPHMMLVTGAIWSVAHIFSTQVFSLNALAYVGFLITIPHMFFSLRTWQSGKGWFAIIFHSAWNMAFLLSDCSTGARTCVAFGEGEYFGVDMFSLALAGSLLAMTSILYSKSNLSKSKFKIGIIASIIIFIICEVVINLKYAELFLTN